MRIYKNDVRSLLSRPALIIPKRAGRSFGRMRATDVAFPYRMGAGFPGDVNRGHPASIEPCLIDVNAPPTVYGQPVVVDPTTQGVRPLSAGDSALTDIWGVTCRPYPFQQSTTSLQYGAVNLGSAGVAAAQPIDVLTGGYIMVAVVGSTVKGGAVFIWIAASSGSHVQGGFEAASGGGSTIALNTQKFKWNSPPDSSGVAELKITF